MMNDITVKALGEMDMGSIHEAFRRAFADYVEPFDLSEQQLEYMLERRGCDLDLSFGAFSHGKLVGFTLNGIGTWDGRHTAYDTGTGVVKEFRKRGIATGIFNESLPVLQNNGVTQYLLEVIRTNTKAFDLYLKAGFKVTREFDYYICPMDSIHIPETNSNSDCLIKRIQKPDWDRFSTFWDFSPSWQNSVDSIRRKLPHFTILGAYGGDELLGYGMIERETGDIPQLAIGRPHRRKGLASALLENLLQNSETDTIQIINADAAYEPFKAFARSVGLAPGHGQYEMILEI